MRPFWIGASVAMLTTACAQPAVPAPSATPPLSTRAAALNPANIKRVARELPGGYELTGDISGSSSPEAIWGLAGGRTTPPRCSALVDPGGGRDQAAQGISASGAGGIVDAVIVTLRPGPVALDPDLAAACRQWTTSAGRTTAAVRLTDSPPIEGAETVGMVADIRTFVESGAEIVSRTYTFVAYLGDHYAFTALITDPGSALPALPPQFAADLLAKTVSTVRG